MACSVGVTVITVSHYPCNINFKNQKNWRSNRLSSISILTILFDRKRAREYKENFARPQRKQVEMKRKRPALDPGASSSKTSRQAQGSPWDIEDLRKLLNCTACIHKSSTTMIQDIISQVINELNLAIKAMQAPEALTDYAYIVNNLKSRIKDLAPLSQMKTLNNEILEYVKNLLVLLDLIFDIDISEAYMQSKCPEPEVVNQIVANYLYRHNQFEVGDVFIREAGVPEAATYRSHYKEMHEISRVLHEHNVVPAIDWIHKNRYHPELAKPRLQFELYRQQYLEMLKSGVNPIEAINFMRTYLTPFDLVYAEEVKSLAGCVLWIGRLKESPYTDLLSSAKWYKLAKDFTEKFLGLLGQSTKCPLTTVCNVGAHNLPLLLKLKRIVKDQEEWEAMESLPCDRTDGVEEYNFHSVFVCQQCGENATDENPPMLLPCSHTLCWNSVIRLSRAGLVLFRCPFCSSEVHLNQCLRLHL